MVLGKERDGISNSEGEVGPGEKQGHLLYEEGKKNGEISLQVGYWLG
jgi:hypothetical protein